MDEMTREPLTAWAAAHGKVLVPATDYGELSTAAAAGADGKAQLDHDIAVLFGTWR